MITVEESIVIRRPVEEVFAFVADQRNAPRWQSGLLEVRRTTDGPLGIGTRHTLVRKFLGQRIEGNNEYVEYMPDRIVTFRGTADGADFEASYRTEPAEEGTRLTSRIEMQPMVPTGPAESSMAADLEREVVANLGELKELLESGIAVFQSQRGDTV